MFQFFMKNKDNDNDNDNNNTSPDALEVLYSKVEDYLPIVSGVVMVGLFGWLILALLISNFL